MALIQSDWSATTVNGHLVLSCDLEMESTNAYDSFTKKTPKELDPTKPWLLFVNTVASTTLNDTTLPVDLWVGWNENSALADNSATDVTATNCTESDNAIMDDIKGEKMAIRIDPYYTGTAVKSATDAPGIINPGVVPYYIFNLDGTDALSSATAHIIITQ